MPQKYIQYQNHCEICGAPFKRSALQDQPPRFCGQACLNKWRVGRAYEKYKIDPKWLPIIKRTYQEGVGDGEVSALAKKIGVPRTKVTNTARAHGWVKKKRCSDYRYHWVEKELEIVQSMPDHAPISIQRRLKKYGFTRSISGIEIQRTKLRVVANRKGVSAQDLAMCMGLDDHCVLALIRTKKLVATRAPGYEGPRVRYVIKAKDIRRYIIEYLPEVDITKCDKYWLVDILTEGKMGVSE